jgi:hypothetical protein
MTTISRQKIHFSNSHFTLAVICRPEQQTKIQKKMEINDLMHALNINPDMAKQ